MGGFAKIRFSAGDEARLLLDRLTARQFELLRGAGFVRGGVHTLHRCPRMRGLGKGSTAAGSWGRYAAGPGFSHISIALIRFLLLLLYLTRC
jgi:hypothetical protein